MCTILNPQKTTERRKTTEKRLNVDLVGHHFESLNDFTEGKKMCSPKRPHRMRWMDG